MIRQRLPIAALVLSASVLVGIATKEGYVETAAPPVKGDVPTNGFGSTGADIKLGDKTDPVRALIRLQRDADEYAKAVKRCAPVPMYQYEFDAYVSLAYNIGPHAFCTSTLAQRLTLMDYPGACAQILRWDRFKGRQLPGLTKRRQAEYRLCMGEQA
ncbi:MAG: lysozyme [Mizugakiibacter sp.]|uniref:lysozyme n=1 Tax=Mizugakiibacter sp. TaxID=1972610 RepID=UPI00320CFC4D